MLSALFASCSTTTYFQIYNTGSDNGVLDNNKIVFEDKNCKVQYNLWSEGGNIGFSIYNKAESDLTVHLNKTFFVINSVAYEYFQNRTFSSSSNYGTTVTSYSNPYYWNYNISKISGTTSNSFSTSYMEKQYLTIPPKTLVNISEFKVVNNRFISCELNKYPSRRNVKTLKFNKENSPIVFSNIITYSTTNDTLRLENKFFVNEITNLPSSEVYKNIDTAFCGQKLDFPVKIFNNVSPGKFYVKYYFEK